MLLLSAYPSIRLAAQTVDQLAVRLAGMTAVTGLEQAMTDTLLTLLPGARRDRAGNVTATLGTGSPRRLAACALDVRLAGTRATGRSFDDRVGSAAQVLALRRLDRAALKHHVIFVWSTLGLEGAKAVAATLGTTARRVHAIDTFVSADSPLELPNFAVAPIGEGAVARALDNSSITPPAYVDSLVALARAHGVKLQVGTTNGGNDGSVFTPYGVVDVPLGWPLRYSHSPAEVIDLRDVVSLADMIQAVAERW